MFTVKNWEKYQHYKPKNPEDRPIWLKLYSSILDDYEFQLLPLEARALLPMLWLLAGQYDGIIPDIKKIAFRLRISETEVTKGIKPLIDNGSIICLESFYKDSIPEYIEKKNIEDIEKIRIEKTLVAPEESFFETHIWPIYPRTRRGNMQKAKRAYERALTEKRATQEEIINGLDTYRRCDEVERGYAKGAEAWFNADGWANSYKSPRSNDKGQKASYMDSLIAAAKKACQQIDAELDAGDMARQGDDTDREAGRVPPRISHQQARNLEAMASSPEPSRVYEARDYGDIDGTDDDE